MKRVMWIALALVLVGFLGSLPALAEELEEKAAPKWLSLIGMDPPGLPEVKIYTWGDYSTLQTSVDYYEDGEYQGDFSTVPPINSPCKWVKSSNIAFWWPDDFFPSGITDPEADGYWENYQPTNEVIEACYPEDAKSMMNPIVSYKEMLTNAIYRWQWVPNEYWGYASYLGENFKTRSAISFGMVMSGETVEDFKDHVLPIIYRSSWMLQVLFDWAMPAVEAAFKEMPPDHQKVYLDILRHGEQYLKTYNHKREEAYLARLERGSCAREEKIFRTEEKEWYSNDCATLSGWDNDTPTEFCACADYFVRISPGGKSMNKYRKLEAFFFRRVRQGVEPSVLLHWVTRTRERLEAAQK